ncbi:RNA-binding domain-containing protein [Dacryopinax primogenitus]|uniref:RNA-binding domain-containing protein n=1 Tax=Dacryopinax primogenitus (strain DJM 731) TaxID=1858805 RepID=M5GG02_DACPD|nr:RNA-binding domain-containing protein [Dacryopinax primogenitus]EJU04633.1 RNA-binding domain-containing protein [Dacryopinax primogenitus]
MEQGTKTKRTVFIGNLGSEIDQNALVAAFSTFGDIVDATIPSDLARDNVNQTYRGIAFLTYTSPADAQDAIDNMDLNIFRERILRVSLARPIKGPAGLGGGLGNRAIWESEEWLKDHSEGGPGVGKADANANANAETGEEQEEQEEQ